ncbi:hypothetical protein HWV62_638 [Athelia sp. TMB]|nr:hypothetical protein HWV62_638 [Athelia sp. TMB]
MDAVTFALVFLGLATAYLFKAYLRPSRRLPPGPRGWPLIGNLLDMPTSDEWVRYAQWVREFKSDVIHLEVCGTHIVILNSVESAVDLLEKRSSLYSSRPPTPMMSDLMGWSWNTAMLPYNDEWRAQRRHFHGEFDGRAISKHYPPILRSTQELLQRLLNTPEQWQSHIRHLVGATILDVAYGIEVLPVNDPYVHTAEAAFASVSEAMIPGAFLVDVLPILKYVPSWMPGAGFKRKAEGWKKLADAVFDAPFAAMKQAMAAGTAKSSFSSRSLRDIDVKGNVQSQEFSIQAAAGTMYNAGSDTTVALLETFMLAMVLHPEVQTKAQAEMDLVLGRSNLPTFADQESLPYLAAVMQEVFRWQVVAPFGVPHMSTADDEYRGYYIPEGTIVIPNAHQMLNDEHVYPEPSKFNPERFFKDGKIDLSVRSPLIAAFGFGRRICPGRALGESSAWLAAGSILAMFNLSKATDHNGVTIEPSGRYTSGLVRHPETFKCQITPRSNEVRNLIIATERAGGGD